MQKYYSLTLQEIFSKVKSSEQGLSSKEVEERLKKYGKNEIRKRFKLQPWIILIRQIKSPLTYILFIAIIVSLLIQHYTDFILISAILVLNIILGFIQEYRAEKALEELTKFTIQKARVLRDNKIVEIDSRLVVPGDILILEKGMIVAADARLIEAKNLATNEAVLTGDSLPVEKEVCLIKGRVPLAEIKNVVFAGTTIVRGHAKAVVFATAKETEFGKIAEKLKEIKEEKTPLAEKFEDFGKILSFLVIFLSLLIGILFWIEGKLYLESLVVILSLAVSAIPEGLPTIATITLSLAIKKLAKENALVKKLNAAEALGSITTICTDKTGTITKNELAVEKLWVNKKEFNLLGKGFSIDGDIFLGEQKLEKEQIENEIKINKALENLLRCCILCNNAEVEEKEKRFLGDPTEIALLILAKKFKFSAEYERVKEFEFDAERKLMSVVSKIKNTFYVFTKGSVEAVLKKSKFILENGKILELDEKKRREILEKNNFYAENGLRVLGFAFKIAKNKISERDEAEKELVFLGIAAMKDSIRENVKESIRLCEALDIKVKIITGDHPLTAFAIAKEIGLVKNKNEILSSVEWEDLSLEEKKRAIENYKVFARFTPKQKLELVMLLKEKGETIAVTGDGINDVLALKTAQLGIAVNYGTDVAKEAADIILLDNNFATIVKAAIFGRKIFLNIKDFVKYLLAANFDEISLITWASLIGLPLPLKAVHILWINLVTDSLPALAIANQEIPLKNVKKRPSKFILRGSGIFIFSATILASLAAGTSFLYGLNFGIIKARSLALTACVLFELLLAFSCQEKDIFEGGIKNKWLLSAVILSFLMHIFILYCPFTNQLFGLMALSIKDWILVFIVCMPSLFVKRIERGIKKMFKI